MPVFLKHDKDGSYYQYGRNGAKYYFTPGNEKSKNAARQKAIDQMYAAEKNKEQHGGMAEKIKIVENQYPECEEEEPEYDDEEDEPEELEEDEDFEWVEENDGKWIQKAIKHPGALREKLGVKEGKNIPVKKLNEAIKKGEKDDATAAEVKTARQARLAKTLRKFG